MIMMPIRVVLSTKELQQDVLGFGGHADDMFAEDANGYGVSGTGVI